MGQILADQVPGPAAVSRAQALSQRAQMLGLDLPMQAAQRLARFHELLARGNERMNLVGNAEFEDALDRHYADSLAPLALGLFAPGARVIDVGSGAGFPGIPLAVARPDLQVTLLDALQKRVVFLQEAAQALGLDNVRVLHARAEDAARLEDQRERYDVAVSRAVASLPVLMELMLPFVRVGGQAVCYKGPADRGELAAAAGAARLLGGGAPRALAVPFPCRPDWERLAVVCLKAEKTVRQYPRKAGMPARSPLGQNDKP